MGVIMTGPSILSLLHNAALLLSLLVLLDLLIGKRKIKNSGYWQVAIGVIIGIIGIILMMTPSVLIPGIFFDTRSILLGLSGLFFGAVPTIIAMAITAGYRLYLGGEAVWMGVGVIFTSGIVGFLWGKYFVKNLVTLKWWQLYFFGVVIHFAMLLCAIFLPKDTISLVLADISLPVMTIYPLGTALLGIVLVNRLRREKDAINLERAEAGIRSVVEILQYPISSVEKIFELALSEATRLTKSKVSWLYIFSPDIDQIELSNLFVHNGTNNTLTTNELIIELIDRGILNNSECLCKPVIQNNLTTPKQKKENLKDQNLIKIMSIPIIDEDKVVAMNIVANNNDDYDDSDILQLSLLMDKIWKVVKNKKAEKLLQDTRLQLQTVIDNSDSLITIMDLEGRNIMVNNKYATISQATSESSSGKNCFDYLPERIADPSWKRTLEVIKTKKQISYEEVIDQHDGKHTYLATKFPLIDSSGNIYGVCGISTDISEQIKMEEARKEADLLLRTVLENAPITIFAIDDQGKFSLSEGKGLERVGLKPGENVGVAAADLYSSLSYTLYNGKEFTGKEVMDRVLAGETVNAINELRGVYFDNYIGPITTKEGQIKGIVGVATDITDRKNAEDELKKSNEQLRHIASRLAEVQEDERKRLSEELHDQVGQSLAVLNINLNVILNQLDNKTQKDLSKQFEAVQSLVNEVTESIRSVMSELHPSVLDDYGLLAALRWYSDILQKRVGLQIDVIGEEVEPLLPVSRSIALFRITQEALTNVVKHAHAAKVVINVKNGEDSIILSIKDDGLGFKKSLSAGKDNFHLGLNIMQERARAVGGELQIINSLQNGTEVIVKVPRSYDDNHNTIGR